MNFTIHPVEQRSEAWLALRAGLVTGSCANAIVATRKRGSGELAIRRDLRQRIVCEILTKQSLERSFRESDAMQHGVTVEPDAVAAYEAATGQIVQRVGFLSHNQLKAGCSPDGYVGPWDGVVECKCPAPTTHFEYVKANVIPEEYAGQLMHSLWLTGAQWADFVSFDPRFEAPLQLFIKRLRREDVDLTAYELALTMFLREVEADVQAAARLAGEVAVA